MDPLADALAMDHGSMCAIRESPAGFSVMCHYCRLSFPYNFADVESASLFRLVHLDADDAGE